MGGKPDTSFNPFKKPVFGNQKLPPSPSTNNLTFLGLTQI